MNKWAKFFLDNYKLTVILSFLTVFSGLLGFSKLNSESFPSVNFAMALIETRYYGATAEDVETKITKKIEDAIREVSGLKDVKSTSKSGYSLIVVRADMDNEDEDQVMEDLQKAVDGVTGLPTDLREDPSFLEVNSAEFPAIEIAVVGDNANRSRDIIVDLLKEELQDNKGVKDVRPSGFLKRQFNILLDTQKMQDQYIGIEEVILKISKRNLDIPGGDIKSLGVKKLIRVEGKIQNEKELEDVLIRSNFSGQKIYLKDIATVKDSNEEAFFLSSYNAKPATFLVVNKKAGADTLKLVSEVDDIIKRFRDLYKDQVEIKIYNNEANKVKRKLGILSSNALAGLGLVFALLMFFLPWRIGIVASLSLPIAILATVGFMPSFGMNLDSITILALVIALGMLVDNSVVISENFSRLKKDEELSNYDAALKSVKQLWLPVTITGFTTIAAFLPMLVTSGIMGQFIKWIPVVVSLSLIISLMESFFLLPMRLRFFAKSSSTKEDSKDWFDFFVRKFESLMNFCVRRRYLTSVIFVLIISGAFALLKYGNQFILFPPEQTEAYIARVEFPSGQDTKTTLSDLNNIVKEIESKLGDWQRDIVARAGISNMGPTDPEGSTGENHGLITIYASDYAKNNIGYYRIIEKLRQITYPKATKLSFKEVVNGPPVGSPINATVRSNNKDSLQVVVDSLVRDLSSVEGIINMGADDIKSEDEIQVLIDYDKADRLGLNVESIGSAIRVAFSGMVTSKVVLNNKEVDLNVRLLSKYKSKLSDLESIKIMDRSGNLIPLSTVAIIKEKAGQLEKKRFDFKPSKTLIGYVDPKLGMTSAKANEILKEKFKALSSKYADVSLVFGGEEENTKESMQSLALALVLSLFGIFGLLVFLFKSYLKPFIIMTTIPLGMIGFSIAFYLHQKPISFMSMIGVIGLAGIIVNSGIVLISFIDQLREETDLPIRDILVKASAMRLRAVFVTSLTTICGLVPTAYGIGGSDDMLSPLTLAMAWGLTSGTILTLIWVPCAYGILEDFLKITKRKSAI